jgi:hypothetical protein
VERSLAQLAVRDRDDRPKARRNRCVADERGLKPELTDKPQSGVLVDVRSSSGYAADKSRGEGVQEAGVSPARSRHCDRGANPKTPPTPQALGRPGEQGAGSQETGLSPMIPKRGEDPEKEA